MTPRELITQWREMHWRLLRDSHATDIAKKEAKVLWQCAEEMARALGGQSRQCAPTEAP